MTFLNLIITASLFAAASVIYYSMTKLKYDERQKIVQGDAFKYGFLTQIFISLLYSYFNMQYRFDRLSSGLMLFLTAVAGFCVFCLYCVWKDAFFAIGKDTNKILKGFMLYSLICVFYGKLSLVVAYLQIKEEGQAGLTPLAVLFIMAIAIFIITVNIYIKNMVMKNEESKA